MPNFHKTPVINHFSIVHEALSAWAAFSALTTHPRLSGAGDYPSTNPFIHPSVRPSIHPSICLFIRPFTYLSICRSGCSPAGPWAPVAPSLPSSPSSPGMPSMPGGPGGPRRGVMARILSVRSLLAARTASEKPATCGDRTVKRRGPLHW